MSWRSESTRARSFARHATLSLALFVSCGGGDDGPRWLDRLPADSVGTIEPPTTDVMPLTVAEGVLRTERHTARGPARRETVADEIRLSRSGVERVASDARDAWIVPGDATLVLADSIQVGARVRTAVASNDAVAKVELRLVEGERTRVLAEASTDAMEAPALWAPLSAEIPSDALPTARIVLSVTGAPDAEIPIEAPWIGTPDPDPPLVVLISIDTLRADHLGCYGYERDTSPRLDALARNGFLFEQCTSPSPWTLPAYGSLLTGLLPSEHRAGVAQRAALWFDPDAEVPESRTRESLRDDASTLAEELGRAGFKTGGFYCNPFLDAASGLGRGFDSYTRFQYNAKTGVDLALAWMDEHGHGPAFLFLQLTDPHWPYAPPAPFDSRFGAPPVDQIPAYPPGLKRLRTDGATPEARKLLTDLYDAEIAFTDAELGRLFDAMSARGDLERALVIVHSDHGEELWDHGGFEHGHTLHDELLRVPFLLYHPTLDIAPRRITNHVRTIDLFPTVLDLVGLPVPEGTRGSSLAPILRRPELDVQLTGFAESMLYAPPIADFEEAKCIIADGYKLVLGVGGDDAVQLYDLATDPGCRVNVAADLPEVTRELSDRLRAMATRALRGPSEALGLSEHEADALGNLGYADALEDD